jgi:hypothetical protein
VLLAGHNSLSEVKANKVNHNFNNNPQISLQTAKNTQEYTDYAARQSEKYERKLYLDKKGDIFSGMGCLFTVAARGSVPTSRDDHMFATVFLQRWRCPPR